MPAHLPIARSDEVEGAREPGRSDRGETLVEILVALVILGIGVVALMGGLATAVFGSSLHRNQSDADAALVMALENIKALPYVPCTLGSSTAPTYSATPTGSSPYTSATYSTWPTYTTSPSPAPSTGYFVVTTQLWNGSTFYTPSAASPCTPDADSMQLITITAVSRAGGAEQQTSVVKGHWS